MRHVHDYMYDHCAQKYICECGDETPHFSEMVDRLEESENAARDQSFWVFLFYGSVILTWVGIATLIHKVLQWL